MKNDIVKRIFIILTAVVLFVSCGKKNSAASVLEHNDLSYSLINPDSVPTDGMCSWWTDSFKTWWNEGNPVTERIGREPLMESIWLYREEPLGFRGSNCQRFYIHLDTVYRINQTLYHLKGRTRCKEEICHVSGNIMIDSVRVIDMKGKDFMQIDEEGYIYGHFELEAMQDKPVADLFGNVIYGYLIHNGTVYYNALEFGSDGYCNNQYRGKWVDYAIGDTLICNWGDYRIPDSDNFDIGCGVFSPNDKYYNFGWKTYMDRWCYSYGYNDAQSLYYDSIYTADENWWNKITIE